MENHLRRALRVPTDKLAGTWNTDASVQELLEVVRSKVSVYNSTDESISASLKRLKTQVRHGGKYIASLLPSGRFRDDFIISGKFLRPIDTLGLSVNMEHCKGVVWKEVFAEVPLSSLKVVVYHRTNVVKMAISADLGMAAKKQCGSANVRAGRHCNAVGGTAQAEQAAESGAVTSSSGVRPINWTPLVFCRRVAYWQSRQATFFKAVQDSILPAIGGNETAMLYGFSYEQLQLDFKSAGGNAATVVARLQNITAPDRPQYEFKQLERKSQWVKRGTEDLRLVLSQFDAILARTRDPSCAALHAQLTSAVPEVFPRHTIEITNCGGDEPGSLLWKCVVTPSTLALV
jgi:hypothetical protein